MKIHINSNESSSFQSLFVFQRSSLLDFNNLVHENDETNNCIN